MGDDARKGEGVVHAAVESRSEVPVAREGKGVVHAAVEGGGEVLVAREGKGVVLVAVKGGGVIAEAGRGVGLDVRTCYRFRCRFQHNVHLLPEGRGGVEGGRGGEGGRDGGRRREGGLAVILHIRKGSCCLRLGV